MQAASVDLHDSGGDDGGGDKNTCTINTYDEDIYQGPGTTPNSKHVFTHLLLNQSCERSVFGEERA